MFEFPSDFGRYRLTGIAGEGGMATVYRAVLPGPMGFEKRLVVKVIRPALVEDEEFLRALVTEALLGCQLHHPNIVEVYEFNQHEGRYYLAMELVDGISLSYLVRRHRKVGHAVPTPVTLHLLGQILDGLEYAHAAKADDGKPLQLIHRDLKPSNIAVTPNGMVKILDFGIARVTLDRAGLETSGSIRGTPRYMSPEQIETPMDIAAGSDLFSLGAVLYELITVRSLFAPRPGQDPIDLVVNMPLEDQITEVEYRIPGIGDIFRKMIARTASLRYQSARAVNRDLKVLNDKYADPEAARQYLAGLVTEYKEEASAEELVPEFFEPGFATGFEPWVAPDKEDGAPPTEPAKRLHPPPEPAGRGDEQPTIPLPPRPDQLSGRQTRLGPSSSPSGLDTASRRAAVQRQYYADDPRVDATPTTPTTVTVRETGAHWGVVAALAVPLALIAIVGLTVGLVRLLSPPQPVDPFAGGGGMIVIEDVSEPVTVEPPTEASDRTHRPPEPTTAEPEDDPTPEPREERQHTPEPVTAEPPTPERPTGFGKLKIDAEPWATVTIDGTSYGETPVVVTLSAGEHRLEMSCMGEGPATAKRVTVEKDRDKPFFKQFPDHLCP